MFLDDRDSEINGLLIKLIAADPEGCFLLGCDEDEAIDAGDPHVPSGLDEVAELGARLSKRRGRRILGGLEVDDVVRTNTIDGKTLKIFGLKQMVLIIVILILSSFLKIGMTQ